MMGLKRLFHAHRLSFKLDGKQYDFEAPMDAELAGFATNSVAPVASSVTATLHGLK